jgi:hypothetical protein
MKTAALAVFAVLALVVSAAARAHEMNLATLDEVPNIVHLRTGAEYGFVAGIGYARVLPLADRHLVLTSDATLPWASLDTSDYRLRLGVMMPLLSARRWKLAAALAPTFRGLKTEIARLASLGADTAFVAGYYSRHWFTAAEVGLDWAITSYVAHSQSYRDSVHAGARDGWYANPGGNVRAGAQAGASFGRYEAVLRAGVVRDTAGEEPLLPIYGTLVLNAKW